MPVIQKPAKRQGRSPKRPPWPGSAFHARRVSGCGAVPSSAARFTATDQLDRNAGDFVSGRVHSPLRSAMKTQLIPARDFGHSQSNR